MGFPRLAWDFLDFAPEKLGFAPEKTWVCSRKAWVCSWKSLGLLLKKLGFAPEKLGLLPKKLGFAQKSSRSDFGTDLQVRFGTPRSTFWAGDLLGQFWGPKFMIFWNFPQWRQKVYPATISKELRISPPSKFQTGPRGKKHMFWQTQAFSMQTRAFSVQTQAFSVQTQAFSVQTQAFSVQTQAFLEQSLGNLMQV